jgi:transposase
MPKRITIAPHLSLEELESRYRKATDPVERSHYQILWLLAGGKTSFQVAEVTGYSLEWIRTVARRYNQLGSEGVGDGRHNNPGAKPLLDEVQTSQLLQSLEGPASDGGLWNGRKVADWMSEVLERRVSPQRGWEYYQEMEFRLRVPRAAHQEADPIEQEDWKKK